MKTEVILKRELFGMPISQSSQSEFFSATDLIMAGNRYRAINNLGLFNMSSYLSVESTKEFILSIEAKYNCKALVSKRGKGGSTWVHPLLFIDIALAISPSLKLEVYEWLFDHLVKFRNDSGDSYKEASVQLYRHHTNNSTFPELIKSTALKIKETCNVENWQEATQEQLKQRDKIHRAIILYSNVLTDTYQIIRLALLEK